MEEELNEEQLQGYGHKQSPATKKKIAKSVTGKKNPAYKNGKRSYRTKTGAKPGDLVHHRDHNRNNNATSNLRIIKKKDRGKHDSHHKRQNNFKKKWISGVKLPL